MNTFGLSSTEGRARSRAMSGSMFQPFLAASNSSGGNGLTITDLLTASRNQARPESNSICPALGIDRTRTGANVATNSKAGQFNLTNN